MNDELRRTMQKAAGIGEPAVGDAFARFTAVKRRAAIARGAVVAVAGLTAAVALIFTLPGLDSGDTGGNLTRGDATSPPNVRAVKHYVDPLGRFELDHPAELHTGPGAQQDSPDVVEFYDPRDPPYDYPHRSGCGHPSCSDLEIFSERPEAFYVQVIVEPKSQGHLRWLDKIDRYRESGVVVDQRQSSIDGRTAERWDATFHAWPDDIHGATTDDPKYWCESCTVSMIVIEGWLGDRDFIVRAVTNNARVTEFRDELDLILDSIDLRP